MFPFEANVIAVKKSLGLSGKWCDACVNVVFLLDLRVASCR